MTPLVPAEIPTAPTTVTLSFTEQIFVTLSISMLTVLAVHAPAGKALVLSWYEQFIVGMAISMLMVLAGQTTNATAQESIQAGVTFLQGLMYGEPLEQGAIQAAIAFLQQLLYGQVPIA